MDIGYEKIVSLSFQAAVEKTIASLQKYGFGIITDIDVKKTVKEKLGLDFKNYRILGACNPALAHTALLASDEIGLLIPCNVIVYEKENSGVVVAAVLPSKLFELLSENKKVKELEPLVQTAEISLKHALDEVSE